MAIADGTYEVLSLLDVTMAVDVSGNSTANSANVRLWGRNGTNGQKWTISTAGGISTILDAETGRSLDVAGGTQARGTNVWMWTANGSLAQQWVLTEDGTQAINGTAYPVVMIGAFGASTYVLDCAGGSAAIQTNIQIWTSNSTAAQRFVLIPTEWLATTSAKTSYPALPTPASGTGGTTRGTALGATCAIDSDTWYPAWNCAEPLYQVAYRTRTRDSGADWFNDWTNWKSIADGSTAWDGFGTPGASNCTAVSSGGLQWSPNGVSVDNSSTYDRTDVEVSVRSWRSTWGAGGAAHGATYTYSTATVRSITISSVSVLLSPDGITVTWASDCTRDGNIVTLESGSWGIYTVTGDASGSVTIPQHSIYSMPEDGDTLNVTVTMTTTDGLTASKTVAATVTYESSHGTTLTLTATVDDTLATITASDASARAWLMLKEGHSTRFIELDGSSPWTMAPPLGVPWRVLASVTGVGTWASVIETFVPIEDDGYHITSQDLTKDLAIFWGEDDIPKADPTFSRSVDAVEAFGRERPVYVAHDATEQRWTVEGVTYGEWIDLDTSLADWAIHAGHVYFRSPQGWWAQACVTGGSIEQSRKDIRAISLTLVGEVW